MSKWEDILNERETFANGRDETLRGKVSTLQTYLWSQLSNVLDGLKTDANGRLKLTVGNIRAQREVNRIFASFGDSTKGGLAKWLANGVKELLGINRRYIKQFDKRFGNASVEERALKVLMENLGYDMGKGMVIKGSWLDGLMNHAEVKARAMQRLSGAMAAGTDLATFRKTFRDEFLNPNGLGLLEKHYDLHTHNFYMGMDRTISDIYAKEAGLEYFVFTGQAVANSRQWCLEKKGRMFHVSIFQKWDNEQWPGKIKGAPTKQVLGGYRCLDHAGYISNQLAKQMVEEGRPHGLTKEQLEKLMNS